MQHFTGSFQGLNETKIFTQHWLPETPPRAVILLAHGLAEHSGRYIHVAEHMTQQGYALYTLDHRGHGQSEGMTIQIRNFEDYVADLRTYFDQVRAAHPSLPIFLYGHSMGSLVALLFAFRYQDELAGLITTGTALKFAGTNPVLVVLLKGLSRVLPNVRLVTLAANGVSRDPAVVERYVNDPLVHVGRMRLALVAEVERASQKAVRLLPTLRLPYLALHGSADPICMCSATEIIRQSSGSPDTTVKVYDGLYHEIHNEPEQAQVLADITTWLEQHLEPV